ncbi:MAG: phosphatase PAP2 family protein [Paracoccaceae bacterium]
MLKSRLAAYGILGFSLSIISYYLLDNRIYHLTFSEDEATREFWHRVTEMGNPIWTLVLLVIVWTSGMVMSRVQPDKPYWNLLPHQSVYVFAAVAVPAVFTVIVKGIVGRARPYLYDAAGPNGFDPLSYESLYKSWPSGHTTTAFAFAVAVILLYPRTKYLLLPLAVMTGYSRMVLGAHYLADVIMGITVGTIGAILVYRWLAGKLKI